MRGMTLLPLQLITAAGRDPPIGMFVVGRGQRAGIGSSAPDSDATFAVVRLVLTNAGSANVRDLPLLRRAGLTSLLWKG